MKPTLEATQALVFDLIDGGPTTFDQALQAVVRYQWEHIAELRRFWQGRGFHAPAQATSPFAASDVPGVPTDVFQHVRLVSDEAEPQRVFRTSGTTHGARGQLWRLSTAAYDRGAIRQFQRLVPEARPATAFFNILTPPEQAPDSSLTHMAELLPHSQGIPAQWFFGPEGVDSTVFKNAVAHAAGPVVVLATAFALVETLDALADDPGLPLPPGSIVIETGGFKGRKRTLSRQELYRQTADTLGVRLENIRSEYSMTELSSQLYSLPTTDVEQQLLVPPPWCQVRVVDPRTLQELPSGETGIVRFVDLANIDVPLAIQTSDLGILNDQGHLRLLGRAPGATPRGCSLAVEEILEVIQRP